MQMPRTEENMSSAKKIVNRVAGEAVGREACESSQVKTRNT